MAQWILLDDGNFASGDQQIGVMSPQMFVEYVNELEYLAYDAALKAKSRPTPTEADCDGADGESDYEYAIRKRIEMSRPTPAAPDRANAPGGQGGKNNNQLSLPGNLANPPGQVS